MRGDSLRDFYAKLLALVGLGTLASVGALVDYWPAKPEMPRIAGLAAVSQTARPDAPLAVRTLGDATSLVAATSDTAVRTSIRSTDRPRQTVADQVAAAGPEAILAMLRTADQHPFVLAGPESIDSVQAPDSVDVRPSPTTSLYETLADSGTSDEFLQALHDEGASVVGALLMPTPPAAAPGGITGVFRKTGSSIATVGVKTGTTIVGAFRAVGGAFRKIL